MSVVFGAWNVVLGACVEFGIWCLVLVYAMRPISVSMISLGCPRTLVDSELLLGRLAHTGYRIVDQVEGADVALVNTCAFIQESINESIETILDLIDLKKAGKVRIVIVAGCLAQRFIQELPAALAEVNGFVGVDGYASIDRIVEDALAGQRPMRWSARPASLGAGARVALTPNHYAYLKISEGCLRGCSFCIIPKIKGPLVSRPIESLVDETRRLVEERGVKELIVVGQDTSDYGRDLYGRSRLAELMDALSRVEGLRWIRLLYCHPQGVTDALMDVIASRPTICKYLDMAIEHSEDRMLRLMHRGMTRQGLLDLIATLRARVPGIALRTSVIVGFPGERDEDVQGLLDFLRQVRFDRLGAFRYSREEGTRSYHLPDQVPAEVMDRRYDAVMQLQQHLSTEQLAEWQGRTLEVIIDEAAPNDPRLFLGRSQADCPEVDGLVYVHGEGLQPGLIVPVTITDTYEYDLVGNAHVVPHVNAR